MAAAIIQAFLLSLGLILPLGVQNTFILTQGALHRSWSGALPAVITAAICDTILISVAILGVSLVVLKLVWFKTALSWVGVLFLAYMGWATWRSEPKAADGPAADEWPLRRQVLFAASVSLLNPHAILDTVAVVGTNALHYSGTPRLAYALTAVGVSWLWFAFLALAGRLVGLAASGMHLRRWLNRGSALIMWGVAAQFLYSLI